MLHRVRQVLASIRHRIRRGGGDARPAWLEALRPSSSIPGAALPRVGVVVLNRNGAPLLDRMLRSLAVVDGPRVHEVVVVDHASSDGSIAIVEQRRAALPIRLVRCGSNHSFAYSCNRAAERTSADLLLFVNNDIVFVEPVVEKLSVLAAGGALVGLKLLGDQIGGRFVDHFGLRFRWHDRRDVAQPFAPAPMPQDSALCGGIVEMPGVTAAVMMCRRDVFLSLGGFCENYVYGYEDVDLCLKFRAAGRPVLCRNDIAAIHGDRATRGRMRTDARRAWHRHNVAVLRERLGFFLRRELSWNLFVGDGCATGRRPRVVVVGGARARILAQRLADGLSWHCRHVARGTRRIDLAQADLLIDLAPPPPRRRILRASPLLIRMAWASASSVDWRRADLTRHIVVACTAAAAADIAAAHGLTGRPPPVLPAGIAASDFSAWLAKELQARLRVFVRHGPATTAAMAGAVARELWRRGYLAEAIAPRRPLPRYGDAILWLGARAAPILDSRGPDQILITAGGDVVPGAVAVPWGEPATIAEAVARLLPALAEAAMAVPRDPPLAPRPPFDGDQTDWLAAPDPCHALLAMAAASERRAGWRRSLSGKERRSPATAGELSGKA